LLHSYATHAIPEMLAPDGPRCGPYTRSVLRRRPIRDGERWLLLKEAAFYGDDPSHAFSPPEAFRRAAQAEQGRDAEMIWDGALRRALTIVRIGLANMSCGIIGTQFQSELPDAVNGMLNAYGMSISLYVSQFPEMEAV
jgi:hypothetical protein